MDNDCFELTEDHLKLIKRMNISYDEYCEFGAPCVDPKRPYGNSQVFDDIGEILGLEPHDGSPEEPEFSGLQMTQMRRIHRETETALQVILSSGSFELGKYESKKYHGDYKLVS